MMLATASQVLARNTLPALVAFTLGKDTSLRSWIAVQALPHVTPQTPDEAALTKRKKRIAVAALVVLLGAEFWVISQGSQVVFESFLQTFLAVMIASHLFFFFTDLSKAFKWAAFRMNVSGMLVYRPVPGFTSKPKAFIAGLVAVAMTAQALIWSPTLVGLSLVSTALVYRFTGASHQRTLSIRKLLICYLVFVGVVTTLSGAMVYFLIKQVGPNGEIDVEVDVEGEEELNKPVYQLIRVLVSAWYCCPQGLLISILYRFDYSQHVSRQRAVGVDVAHLHALEPIEAPTDARFYRQLSTTGIIVPTATPRGFVRPYFFTALSSWLSCEIVLAAVWAKFDLQREFQNTAAYDLAGFFLSIPVVVGAVLVTAKIRGEFTDLWTYREVWSVPADKVKGIALLLGEGEVEAGTSGEREEASLPEYEDVTKPEEAEEEVPPYAVFSETKA
ncbi:hypothetical protein MNV49_005924 [Pseudohyphozyma bogoriensis]|nr:hypothetical protein MNV49_005924 [Pseudohyphozyma bogoriensis]